MIKKTKKEIEVVEYFCDVCTQGMDTYIGEVCHICNKILCVDCELFYESVMNVDEFWAFCPECTKQIKHLTNESEKLCRRLTEIDTEIAHLESDS